MLQRRATISTGTLEITITEISNFLELNESLLNYTWLSYKHLSNYTPFWDICKRLTTNIYINWIKRPTTMIICSRWRRKKEWRVKLTPMFLTSDWLKAKQSTVFDWLLIKGLWLAVSSVTLLYKFCDWL